MIDAAVAPYQEGDFEAAYELLEPMVRMARENIAEGWFANTEDISRFCFKNPIQEMIWRAHNRGKIRIRIVLEPLDELFLAYASCLYELERFDEAAATLEEAIRWNPADASIRFELAENQRRLDDREGFRHTMAELHPFITSVEELARYHRNLAYLDVEEGAYELATAHLLASIAFVDSDSAINELAYIVQKSGEDHSGMEPERVQELISAAGCMFGPDPTTINAIGDIIQPAYEAGDRMTAVVAATILYNFTGNEDVRAFAERVGSSLESDNEPTSDAD